MTSTNITNVSHENAPFVDPYGEALRQSLDRAEVHELSDETITTFTVRDHNGAEQVITKSFEQFLPAPRRPRGTTSVTDTESFIRTVARATVGETAFYDPTDVGIFADVNRSTITAVLNYDTWVDHRIVLNLQRSPEWAHWTSINNQLVNQMKFAEHIQDGRRSVLEPDAAELMEIAASFRAKKNVSFESGVHTQSGDVQFLYHEETSAKAGAAGTIEIPERFKLLLPVFLNGVAFELGADFKYRAEQGGLQLGYRLDNPEDIIRDAFQAVLNQVENDLGEGFLLVQGVPPQSIASL